MPHVDICPKNMVHILESLTGLCMNYDTKVTDKACRSFVGYFIKFKITFKFQLIRVHEV